MTERLLAADLSRYLVSLHSALLAVGERATAAQVDHLGKFASGSTSEFYGKARLLLPAILEKKGSKLSVPEQARLQDVIQGIEHEFDLIGGA